MIRIALSLTLASLFVAPSAFGARVPGEFYNHDGACPPSVVAYCSSNTAMNAGYGACYACGATDENGQNVECQGGDNNYICTDLRLPPREFDADGNLLLIGNAFDEPDASLPDGALFEPGEGGELEVDADLLWEQWLAEDPACALADEAVVTACNTMLLEPCSVATEQVPAACHP